jgi:Pretoxin HINT domain
MLHAALLWTGLLAALPGDAPPSPQDLKTYDALEHKAGRDAPAKVKLALWCEAHGLDAQRLKHLAQAVLTDPGNATARGLLGQTHFEGRWESPDRAGERIRTDERRAARQAEYNRRRDELVEKEDRLGQLSRRIEHLYQAGVARTNGRLVEALEKLRGKKRHELARAHANLGIWCGANGLEGEALAHVTTAIHFDPSREASWRHLGYVKRHGRWTGPEQAAAEEKEEREQRQADRHWGPLLRRWKAWLGDTSATNREQAEAHLATVTDPRAVSTLRDVFGTRSEDDQCRLASLLCRIDDPRASRVLAEVAVGTPFASARTAAIEALRKRPRRDYAGELVGRVRDKIEYSVERVRGPGTRGVLVVDTSRAHIVRNYDAPPPFRLDSTFHGYVGYDMNGLPLAAEGIELNRVAHERYASWAQSDIRELEERTAILIAEANLQAQAARQRLVADVNEIEAANRRAEVENPRIVQVLRDTAGAPPDLKADEESCNVWWYDTLGYSYQSPPRVTIVQNAAPYYPPPVLTTCFAAGTSVRTLAGPRPIEAIRVGDQVLAQDESSGALAFQPVVFVHHNPPGNTLRVSLADGTSVVCSVYHRFWRANRGWAMARDLEPGDVLRALGGRARVEKVEPDATQPLFNLDVARSRTFFAGADHLLVHDNTLPDHRLKPFDALPVVEGGRPE